MKSELIPINGDPPIPIDRDVTVIGRREFCDVVIPHPSLSKRHCVLVRTDGLLVVRDLISTNGTKVNGQRIAWAALLPNDRLTVGRYKFKVYLGPDDVPSPAERVRSGRPADPADDPSGVGWSGASGNAALGSKGAAPTGFAAPTPLSMPAQRASTEQASPLDMPEFQVLDDDEPGPMTGDGLEILDDDVIELE